MKTATILVGLVAVGCWFWYSGFSEGWRQASVALAAESPAYPFERPCIALIMPRQKVAAFSAHGRAQAASL